MNGKRLHWIEPGSPVTAFPTIETALPEPEGLLAMGGDLSEARLLEAYTRGIFPWYVEGQPILWWSPNPRCILRPHTLHRSRSLTRFLKRSDWTVTINRAFMPVMQACAEPRASQDGTWITRDMLTAYNRLHAHGWAHSVEVWDRDRLVGGIYGLAIGDAFFGESMFSKATNASKVAMLGLCRLLKEQNLALLDCQVESPHLLSMGAESVPRDEFRSELQVLCAHRKRLETDAHQRLQAAELLQS